MKPWAGSSGRGEHLDDADGAGLAVDQRGVGERPADVDADAQRAHQAHPSRARRWWRPRRAPASSDPRPPRRPCARARRRSCPAPRPSPRSRRGARAADSVPPPPGVCTLTMSSGFSWKVIFDGSSRRCGVSGFRMYCAAARPRRRRAPRGVASLVREDREARRVAGEEIVAAHAEAAAVAAAALGVLDQLVPHDAHGVARLRLLDGRVLRVLEVRLHGVHPVGGQRCAVAAGDGLVVGEVLRRWPGSRRRRRCCRRSPWCRPPRGPAARAPAPRKSRSQSCMAISQPAATAAGCWAWTTEPGRLLMSTSR
mgnify:CR=1 FL=1